MAAPTLAATRVPPRWRASARAIEPARAPSVARASFAASRVARARWARSDDERSRGRGLLVAAPSSTARDRFDCETYAGEDNLWTTQELPRLLEFYPKKNPCDGLMLTRGSWSAVASADGASATLTGAMAFHNTTRGRHDVFVPEVSPRVTLLSKARGRARFRDGGDVRAETPGERARGAAGRALARVPGPAGRLDVDGGSRRDSIEVEIEFEIEIDARPARAARRRVAARVVRRVRAPRADDARAAGRPAAVVPGREQSATSRGDQTRDARPRRATCGGGR